jgi:V/A-type H+-transporting ATPase subunit E
MKGLEEILGRIKSDAEARAAQIAAEAAERARERTASFEAESAETRRRMEAETNELTADIMDRARVEAVREERRLIQEEKQDILKEVFRLASMRLADMDDESMFKLLEPMVKRAAGEDGGVLRLSADRHSSLGPRLAGGNVTLGEPADIKGGFLLIKPTITVNYGFEAILSDLEKEMARPVSELLFREEE